jgi:excisionase family DNA binding protein
MAEPVNPDLQHDLASLFSRLGPNWVQRLGSKYLGDAVARSTLLSVRQVAQYLGVSTAIVYRLCASGDLAHLRVSHAIRVRLVDLAAYVELQRKRCTPHPTD